MQKQPNYIDLKNEKLINKTIIKYEYVIKIYISKFKIQPKDYDDAMQEGRIGLLKAIKSYKDGMGSTFTSFASLCIERQLLSYLRSKNRKKNRMLDEYTSFESVLENKKYYTSELEDTILTKLQLENAYETQITHMQEIEKLVFKSYITGLTVNEISEEYKVSKRNVYKIISNVKKVLEEKLNNY